MKNDKLINIINDNQEYIENLLGIDKLKQDIESLKRDNEMWNSLFSKFFKTDNSGELEQLKAENRELKSKNKDLNKQLTRLSKENRNLNSELEQLNANLQALLRKIEQNPLGKLKQIYDSLDAATKTALENLFPAENELSLFASGILRIGKVWDYAAYLRKQHKDAEFEKVKEIFYLLFEIFEKVKTVSLQQVNVGDKFDMDYFSRDNRSDKQSGKVAEVVLKGFLENGKIVKKSIVKVK